MMLVYKDGKVTMNELKKSLCCKKNVLFILLLFVQVVLFYCYEYGDLTITTEHGISFWECLFSGKIRDFYSINMSTDLHAGVYQGEYFAGYDFFAYIIFGIWNLPLWISRQFFGVEYPLDHLWGNIWAKSIVLVFYCGCLYFAYKIMKLVNINDFRKFVAMITTSSFVTLYIILMGQYDVVCVFFILWGIYALFLDKKIISLVAFSIAVPIKIIALLILIPVILYFEKNIIKILGYCVTIIIPMMVFRFLIPFPEMSNTSVFFQKLFNNKIELGYTKCSLFVLVYILFLICCYLIKPANELKKQVEDIAYLCFVSFAIFMVFVVALPYWAMYMVPFLYIIYMLNPNKMYINHILELCISIPLVLSQIMYFYHVTLGTILSNMILGKVFDLSGIIDLGWHNVGLKYLGEEKWSSISEIIHNVCWAVFIAGLIVFLFMNCPWNKRVRDYDDNKMVSKINIYALYTVRAVAVAFILFTPFCGILC